MFWFLVNAFFFFFFSMLPIIVGFYGDSIELFGFRQMRASQGVFTVLSKSIWKVLKGNPIY